MTRGRYLRTEVQPWQQQRKAVPRVGGVYMEEEGQAGKDGDGEGAYVCVSGSSHSETSSACGPSI